MPETDYYNAVHCNVCGKTIVSEHVHDYSSCACTDSDTRVAVDGGNAYAKRTFGPRSDWTELFVPIQDRWQLEHSTRWLVGTHSPLKCEGRACVLHNRSNHSKRSWVQVWVPGRGMCRKSPKTGKLHTDPDSLVVY